ncbi:hypothetical protein LO772_12920 [Yinghuangia sp. ASG 101]|uniref:hypothetical protein n=1 Tax=Yinghuangia sp. ASG 101 TaxID=2896848 RepID=UPI001E501254|nr:hypothetical protein [Yinghuangia sp. ASG 101]UGQ14404.1 hypothetical protein LO772_12920 [Yinghuangia sp. ASG 101]
MPDVPDVPDMTNAPGPRADARKKARTADPRAEAPATREDAAEAPAPDDIDIEAPEADVAEQRTTVVEEEDEDEGAALGWAPVPDGVDPADRTDQQRVVTRDEDEYR